MRTRIKFCGITSLEDALAAVEAGADALGFVISDSPRQVTPETAKRIIKALPPLITTIGVFVDERSDVVEDTADFCGFTAIQLQGSENLDTYSFKKPIIKTYRINDSNSNNLEIDTRICACLFDSSSGNDLGGTGRTFDWKQLLKSKIHKPLILAGGLNSHNITSAIHILHPYAVDVSSGIEKAKGVKDSMLMNEFVRQVRIADTKK